MHRCSWSIHLTLPTTSVGRTKLMVGSEHFARTLCNAGDLLGEGPLWDHRLNRLLWIDILKGCVHSWTQAAGASELVRLDLMIGSIALAGDSDLLLATSRGIF